MPEGGEIQRICGRKIWPERGIGDQKGVEYQFGQVRTFLYLKHQFLKLKLTKFMFFVSLFGYFNSFQLLLETHIIEH